MKSARGLKLTINSELSPKGDLKVRCIFNRPDGSTIECMMPVEHAKFHWDTVYDPVTKESIGEELVIDEGYITLHDQKEKYFAKGIAPLRFLWNSPLPVE